MFLLSDKKYLNYLIILILLNLIVKINSVHRTVQEAKEARKHLLRKYLKKEGSIKLVGGKNEYEGNVEILHNGKWGAVCDDEWDKNEGLVVCKQLGYSYGKITHSGMFGPAKRKFLMDNLFCDGKENELSKCRFDGWGKSDCESSEAAGVVCKSLKPIIKPKIIHEKPTIRFAEKEKIEIRLSGGRTKYEGRVDIRILNGQWGSICGDGWSLLEANVVCRSLNYGYASHAIQTDYFVPIGNTTKILLSGTRCYGNETSLSSCLHQEFGSNIYCPGPKNHVASVICTYELADLVFDSTELELSAHLEDKPMYFLQCAMEENCVASQAYEIQKDNPSWHLETRRLLKFTATVLNSGTADFRPLIEKHLWEWHLCHMHYHSMEVFATFDITNLNGEKVAEGHKASFCLEDNQCNPGVKQKYFCANYGDQGISVNCSDIYRYNIDCQWVDITEMDTGTYTIKVSINPEFKIAEMNYDNNAAICTLLYTESYARVFNCKLERP